MAETLSKIQELALRSLSPKEQLLKSQYKSLAKRLKIDPNIDDPRHFYDTRRALEEGPVPYPESGQTHWISKYKHPWHPHRFVRGIDTITGKKR